MKRVKRHINNGEIVNILFKLRNKENLTIVTVFFNIYILLEGQINTSICMKGVTEEV